LALDATHARLLAGTADGYAVALHLSATSSFPLGDAAPDSVIQRWRPHTGARTRCITFCEGGEGAMVGGGSIITGGSDGSMVRIRLDDAGGFSDMLEEALLPNHNGQVVALLPRGSDLLISGAQDGTIRIWDMQGPSIKDRMRENPEALGPKCLYGLAGYKVWLGSINTDGQRLVSDGADNKIVVHDFSPAAASEDEPNTTR